MSPMAENPERLIQKGYQQAVHITKQHAKSFYFASHWLDPQRKRASYAVYAVCRISDSSVDNQQTHLSAQKKLKEIETRIRDAYEKKPLTQPLCAAFRKTVRDYKIPYRYFDDLLLGMKMDLENTSFADFHDLYKYCYHVAGVVGLIMLKIFGSADPRAKEAAIDLGIAMQLTNILRDIKEDWDMKRLYLPRDDLQEFHIDKNIIRNGEVTKAWEDFMKFQIERARLYYASALKGTPFISNSRCRFVVCLMKDIYAGILSAIERNKYDIFSQRAHTSFCEKLFLTFNVFRKGEYR